VDSTSLASTLYAPGVDVGMLIMAVNLPLRSMETVSGTVGKGFPFQ
jgi:hypothetical protein